MNKQEYLEQIAPRYSGYQELHVHSVGSYRDAVNTVKDIFDATEELGRNAVAITDHGNQTRLFEALKERTAREKAILRRHLEEVEAPTEDIEGALKAMGAFGSVRNPNDKMWPYIEKYEFVYIATADEAIQFIPGVEMYECLPVEGDEHKWHILFLAKDWTGAKALFKLCNLAQLNRYNDMPRCTVDTMRLFLGEGGPGHGHVIATSACLGGKIPDTLLRRYYLNQKKEKYAAESEKLTVVAVDVLDKHREKVADLADEFTTLSEELGSVKELASRKYVSAEKKAKKALDTATESGDGEKIKAAQNAYDALQAEIKGILKAQERLTKLKDEVKAKKAEFNEAKAALETLEKQNRPAAKLQAKITAIDTELETVGTDDDLFKEAVNYALEYEEILGKGNFFIELQDHGLERDFILRDKLIQISKETGIPLTVANDVHYKNPEMKRKRDIVAALRFPNLTVFDIAAGEGNDQLYFKSNEQMKEMFADVPEAIENTNRIAEMCNVYYEKEMHLPQFEDTENGLTPSRYLRKMAVDNIEKKYPDCKKWSKERQKAFKERLNYELGIIDKMGYSSYISIVEDFIRYTKEHFGNESVGPGRGSGAGSLVCYLVGITNIDPLKYNLIFERFLNPERVSMPDIDTDFAPSIRDKVISYVSDRYAYKEDYIEELKGTVCSIFTETVLAARRAIRQVGKVTNVPLSVCDKIAKLVPATPKMTLKKALEDNKELAQLYKEDTQVKKLMDDAMLVENTPVQTGVHAAGVIIADKPVSEYAPLFWNEKKGVWVVQYDMVSCESDLGLLKMDFLGLKNLDIIMRCEAFIEKIHGTKPDSALIEKADDLNVISEIYAKGDTDGIFQFESGGMKRVLRSFAPKQIEDVILLNAAYRPGPMQYIPQVTDVKFGRMNPKYIVPEMKDILDQTYGSPIYQEQIQQIFHEIAGFSLGQADIIRRAMSKKHLDELEAAKDGFVKGFSERGAKPDEIEDFWKQLLDFANYAFNKSHAAAYSVLSYYTAWLKLYYPAEYIASLLSYSNKEDIAMYVNNARVRNITVLPPSINASGSYTMATKKGEIRMGLETVKEVGAAAEKIVNERRSEREKFTSLADFVLRCIIIGVDKSTIDALIRIGALSGFVKNRREAVENLPAYISACRNAVRSAYAELEKIGISEPDTGDLYEGVRDMGFEDRKSVV